VPRFFCTVASWSAPRRIAPTIGHRPELLQPLQRFTSPTCVPRRSSERATRATSPVRDTDADRKGAIPRAALSVDRDWARACPAASDARSAGGVRLRRTERNASASRQYAHVPLPKDGTVHLPRCRLAATPCCRRRHTEIGISRMSLIAREVHARCGRCDARSRRRAARPVGTDGRAFTVSSRQVSPMDRLTSMPAVRPRRPRRSRNSLDGCFDRHRRRLQHAPSPCSASPPRPSR